MSLVEPGLADVREMLQTLVGQKAEHRGAKPKALPINPGKKKAGAPAAARAADESFREMAKLIGAEGIPVQETLLGQGRRRRR